MGKQDTLVTGNTSKAINVTRIYNSHFKELAKARRNWPCHRTCQTKALRKKKDRRDIV